MGRAIDLRYSKALAHDWWKPHDNGELVPGMRFVRNAVEHDWSDALDLPEPEMTRLSVKHVVWSPLTASRRNGRRQYEAHFVGQPVFLTLLALNVVLITGGHDYWTPGGFFSGPAARRRVSSRPGLPAGPRIVTAGRQRAQLTVRVDFADPPIADDRGASRTALYVLLVDRASGSALLAHRPTASQTFP